MLIRRLVSVGVALIAVLSLLGSVAVARTPLLEGHVDITTSTFDLGPFHLAETDALAADFLATYGGTCQELIEVHIHDFVAQDERLPPRWGWVGYNLQCQGGGVGNSLSAYWSSLLGDDLKGKINDHLTHASLDGTLGPPNQGTPIDPACQGSDSEGGSGFGDQLCPVLAQTQVDVDARWDSDDPPITEPDVHQTVFGPASGSVRFTSPGGTRTLSLDGVIGMTDLG